MLRYLLTCWMVKLYYSYEHDLRNRNAPLVTKHAIQRLDDDPIATTARLSRQHLSIAGGAFDRKNVIRGLSPRSPTDGRVAIFPRLIALPGSAVLQHYCGSCTIATKLRPWLRHARLHSNDQVLVAATATVWQTHTFYCLIAFTEKHTSSV